jgi:alkylhydroperoxidase/carboxymuconolactone decarboxylase family protein YurZ
MNSEWQKSKDAFESIDVRELRGNFLPLIQKKAAALPVGHGLRVIQSFEPVPLYTVLAEMGFEHETERVSDEEYHVYFYKASAPATAAPAAPPLQPLGILKFKQVDSVIADQLIKVWERIYKREDAAIDQKTLYLIAFGVGIGAGRMRQATRELIKAYAAGATVEELDEVFALLIWLEGASTFVSEISTSPAFGAYEVIKRMAGQGKERNETLAAVMEKYGERHPDVGIFASS